MKVCRLQLSDGSVCYAAQHASGQLTRLEGDIFGALRDTGAAVSGKLLAPIQPANILCIGLNYRKHAEEGNQPIPPHPVLFMKVNSAVQHPGDPIRLPTKLKSDKVDYECELAVVIGRDCYNVRREDALSYVLGYTCANDVSARDWQKRRRWRSVVSRQDVCHILSPGPCLVTADEIPNPNALGIRTRLNGQTMQDWNTNDMIFDVPTLIEFLSASTVLPKGTVILTGTPHGVGAARKPPSSSRPETKSPSKSTASAHSPIQ